MSPNTDTALNFSTHHQESSSTARTMYEFTQFLKLPRELRNRIWHFVAHVPRIIKLCEVTSQRRFYTEDSNWDSTVTGQSRHPFMLEVSRESRIEAKRYYDLVHERDQLINLQVSNNLAIRVSRSRPLWINFAADDFVLHRARRRNAPFSSRSIEYGYSFEEDTLARIKHLVSPTVRKQSRTQGRLLARLPIGLVMHCALDSWQCHIGDIEAYNGIVIFAGLEMNEQEAVATISFAVADACSEIEGL